MAFRVWHDHVSGTYIQRIFFWNETQSESGVIELVGDKTRYVSRLKQIIAKLVVSPEYRARHRRQLQLPVERNTLSTNPSTEVRELNRLKKPAN
jgi:hypothetical protein